MRVSEKARENKGEGAVGGWEGNGNNSEEVKSNNWGEG